MTTALLVWMGMSIGFAIGAWWAGGRRRVIRTQRAARGRAAVAKFR
jgi:hypothetical protein